MKRTLIMMLVLASIGGTTEAYSQSFLKRLGKTVENAAKNAIERNAERKTEEAVDKVFEGDFEKDKKDKDKQNNNGNNNADVVYDNGGATAQTQPQKGQSLEMTYAKSDFVPGDEIIFEDLLVGEKLGEFPSMWDLKEGNAEIVSVGGENAIHMSMETLIMPYMKEKDYLPEEFTIEFDLYVPCENISGGKDGDLGLNNRYNIDLVNAAGEVVFQAYWYNGNNEMGVPREIAWNWQNGGEGSNGEGTVTFNMSDFNHIAISFNKRALKFYVNGIRIANIPRCDAPTRFQIFSYSGASEDERFIKNVRIAKGAVPLYDRMMTDGKFITYGITFDVGKSTIKPESMGEINRIVQLMNENPTLKFSVEGHTDSTGNVNSNQTLSEQRSQAIVAKLVELGIAQDRLTAVGKGQNSPIADNNTDEGRAKNRRVEFVKK
ncbi:MAG: OmpA family protein [Bacteroidaceae bacterium]|nr:OmpA family protein [Bacteroidaceae bacterium]